MDPASMNESKYIKYTPCQRFHVRYGLPWITNSSLTKWLRSDFHRMEDSLTTGVATHKYKILNEARIYFCWGGFQKRKDEHKVSFFKVLILNTELY